jgi:hypothetical protein
MQTPFTQLQLALVAHLFHQMEMEILVLIHLLAAMPHLL